jgi:hypothetical protein
MTDQCKDCIEAFLGKMKGYGKSLKAGGEDGEVLGKVCNVGRKVKWGEGKIVRGKFAIREPNLQCDIQRSQPFAAGFLPRRHLDIMIVFENKDPADNNHCPTCKMSVGSDMVTINCFVTSLGYIET